MLLKTRPRLVDVGSKLVGENAGIKGLGLGPNPFGNKPFRPEPDDGVAECLPRLFLEE